MRFAALTPFKSGFVISLIMKSGLRSRARFHTALAAELIEETCEGDDFS